MDKLAFAASRNLQLRLTGIFMDMWIFLLFVAIAGEYRNCDSESKGLRRQFHFILQAEKMSDIYCAEQIKIPPTFPHILKLYAKAAIRTQPYDLLQWTCAYFRALANDDIPPVKERLEYPPFCHPSGITPGYLKTLLNAFGHVEKICMRRLLERWQGILLSETTLFQILLVGKFLPSNECHFYKFLAIACGFLGKNLFETMIYVCELLTEEPEGGSAMIPLGIFLQLYEYLANLDCSGRCPCTIVADTAEFFHPGIPPASEESSTLSKLYSTLSGDVEEEEESAMVDVCGFTPSESRSSDTVVHPSTDYGIDTKHASTDEGQHQERAHSHADEDKIRSQSYSKHQRESENDDANPKKRSRDQSTQDHRTSGPTNIPDFHSLDADDNFYDRDDDDLFSYYGGEESEMMEASYEEVDDYEPIGLESILYGICECLQPVRERTPTPPPPDPFDEFLNRMKIEVNENRLPLRFRVPGIGPPVSINRVTGVGLWLGDCARRQEGLVGPRNIRHFLCPDLEDCGDTCNKD